MKRLPMEYRAALAIAQQGEVERYLENCSTAAFSGRALLQLATIRYDNPDGTKSQDIDVKKVKRVAKKAADMADGKSVTPRIVKQAYAECYGEKPPKPLGEQLQNKIGAVNRFGRALEQLPEGALADAEAEYPGVVKRLAKAYSDVASILRRSL